MRKSGLQCTLFLIPWLACGTNLDFASGALYLSTALLMKRAQSLYTAQAHPQALVSGRTKRLRCPHIPRPYYGYYLRIRLHKRRWLEFFKRDARMKLGQRLLELTFAQSRPYTIYYEQKIVRVGHKVELVGIHK
jgi:hypothetical protein